MERKNYLFIMRHAQAVPSNALGDFYRSLDTHGQKQPQQIALKLNHKKITIDKLLVSPSARTKETCDLLLTNLDQSLAPTYEPGLYNAHVDDMLKIIKEAAPGVDCIMIIAHNPGVSLLTEYLSGAPHEFHTADLAILSAASFEKGLMRPREFLFEQMLGANE